MASASPSVLPPHEPRGPGRRFPGRGRDLPLLRGLVRGLVALVALLLCLGGLAKPSRTRPNGEEVEALRALRGEGNESEKMVGVGLAGLGGPHHLLEIWLEPGVGLETCLDAKEKRELDEYFDALSSA